IVITNGFPKDITDHDFIAFRRQSSNIAGKSYTLSQIPEVKIHNYGYKNKGNLTFTDATKEWGLTVPSFTNGAAYADLDNDGDMDMVMNNINDEALVYENRLMNSSKKDQHFLTVHLVGDTFNRNGLGAWVEIYYGKHKQAYEQTPYRGYLSSIQLNPHVGLGSFAKIDSLIVIWPGERKQTLKNINADQTITIDIRQANEGYNWSTRDLKYTPLFREADDLTGIHYIHQDNDFIDYDIQKLLPHKLSEYGPAVAAGDVDGNGLDDIVCGGSFYYGAQLFLQQQNGKFLQKGLLTEPEIKNKKAEDMGLLLFDADGDQDLDLYIASGGYEAKRNTRSYQDRIYINDGKGDFQIDTLALPLNLASKSCVRAADYDRDGDLDLFVAGRVEPWNYPRPVSSYIYRNDSKKGAVRFTDVTATVAPSLTNIGLVCDALWTDFDNDGWQDLLLAGEWMPIIFLKNEKGSFQHLQPDQLTKATGWWNSIAPGDFDNDGDMDYIIGNLGENTFYKGSEQYPISIYAKDFDKNGVTECLTTKYIKDREGVLREYPTHVRDNVVDQMPFIKKRFLTYKAFAEASSDQLFTSEEKKDMLRLEANSFKSIYLENRGNDRFEMNALPKEAQLAPLNGMIADDFNGDGNLDVLINGNDYGTEVSVGRYDALNGLLLKGDGKGGFTPLSIIQSGIYIPGNGKSLVKLRGASGNYLVAASQNKGPLKIFILNKGVSFVPLSQADIAAVVTYKNGKTQKREVQYGSSFLSQSGRFFLLDSTISSIKTIDAKGNSRLLANH
ncbi:MAG TPA: VCBS repeat-containing protein, partial [Flavisolibacter sp.]|nr:VCBS repeat-containing protein [Flavisolibacter sp.]